MNKQEILKKAEDYKKAETLRNCSMRIMNLDEDLITQSLYYFSNLSKQARIQVASIFEREADRIENE